MKNCPNCHFLVNDEASFCTMCGTKLIDDKNKNEPLTSNTMEDSTPHSSNESAQQGYNSQSNQTGYNPLNGFEPPQGYYNTQQNYNIQNEYPPQFVNTTPYVVWSVILIACCCVPLGIWSLIVALNANKQPTYEMAMDRLNTAKIIIIIGGVLGVVANVIIGMLMVFGNMII